MEGGRRVPPGKEVFEKIIKMGETCPCAHVEVKHTARKVLLKGASDRGDKGWHAIGEDTVSRTGGV